MRVERDLSKTVLLLPSAVLPGGISRRDARYFFMSGSGFIILKFIFTTGKAYLFIYSFSRIVVQ
jgi:hypothetical protein